MIEEEAFYSPNAENRCMTVSSVGIVLPRTATSPRRPSLSPPGEFASRAESLGYESVWTSEGWGRDSFVELSEMAATTDAIDVGTSVVNTFSRSPAVLAMAAASVAEPSGGRVRLGVGAGHPEMIEDLHGLSYGRPIQRTKETIEVIQAYTTPSDGPVEYDGDIFNVSGYGSQNVPLPVYNAALGERNRSITGKLCEGWIPFIIPIPALKRAFEAVAAGAREAGRDPEEVTVAPWISAAVSENPDRARRIVTDHLASYIGVMTDDTYKGAVAQQFPDEAVRIAAAWRDGDETGAASHVTDEMLDALAVVGTPDAARQQLRDLLAHPVIDIPIVSIPFEADPTLAETTLEALAPTALSD